MSAHVYRAVAAPGVPRPESGDICALLLDDHQVLEAMLRDLRLGVCDRAALRADLAALVVAHARSEEQVAYQRLLEVADGVSDHEVQHGVEEHAEGTAILLEFLECPEVDSYAFEASLEKVSAFITHHLSEEESSILGPALRTMPPGVGLQIGAEWLAARAALLDDDCGSLENVRAIVQGYRTDGFILDDLPDRPHDADTTA